MSLWTLIPDDVALIILFVGTLLGILFLPKMTARLTRRPPVRREPEKTIPGYAVVLTPDQLSEIDLALSDRVSQLQALRNTQHGQLALEHCWAAFDEIARARRRAG